MEVEVRSLALALAVLVLSTVALRKLLGLPRSQGAPPKTALLVFHADRGHFNFCLPLARRLRARGITVELWANKMCESWVPEGSVDKLRADLGDTNLNKFVSLYKQAVSTGDTDQDGYAHVCGDNFAAFGKICAEAGGPPVSATDEGKALFQQRLLSEDVGIVVWEGTWGKWAGEMAAQHGRASFGLCPSYFHVFRAASGLKLHDFDGESRVRDRPEDVDKWHEMPPEVDVHFTIAESLVGSATTTFGRGRFGAIFADTGDSFSDTGLLAWLDGDELEASERTVTLMALGSQSAVATLSDWAEADLIKGCLAASPRVLVASGSSLDGDSQLREALATGRLRTAAWLPQQAVLGHPNVKCFLSHVGANSTHEALAKRTPIVPLPFFDDQHYIAARLEDLYGYDSASGYLPLRKSLLREGPAGAAVERVAAAIRCGLVVPATTLEELQKGVLAEDGANAAAVAIMAKMGV